MHLLKGEYGVVRPLLLNLANPSAEPRTAYLYAVPNGYAKASIWLNGDAAPIPMPCIGPSPLPYHLREFTLAPRTSRTITGLFMTDGGASLPLELGLTTMPPVQPPTVDHCAPAGSSDPNVQ